MRVPGFFFPPQFWCSWSGGHPYDDLARFGYMLDMKAQNKQNPSIFLATYWNSSLKSGDLDCFIWKSGEFGAFLPCKILCICQSHIFQVKIYWNFTKGKFNFKKKSSDWDCFKGQTQWDHAQISCQNVKKQIVWFILEYKLCTNIFFSFDFLNETWSSTTQS